MVLEVLLTIVKILYLTNKLTFTIYCDKIGGDYDYMEVK